MSMNPQKTPRVRLPSAKSDDQPATRKMLKLVKAELIQRMDARFDTVEARFSHVDARFNKIDARFNEIDAQFKQIDARFGGLAASLSRMELLFEEQTSNNRIALESLQAL